MQMSFLAKRRLYKETACTTSGTVESSDWRIIAHKYRDFPLYRAPQDLINAVSRSLPLILLSSMFGPIPAGLYALAAQVVGAPSVLVGSAVSTAVYPSMVERMRRKEDITSTLKRGTTDRKSTRLNSSH